MNRVGMTNVLSLVERIEAALDRAAEVYQASTGRRLSHRRKESGDAVTSVDLTLDATLKKALLRKGEGWLSEETSDDDARLEQDLVWVVDPLDGTREFIMGIPEFCTSIAAVVGGRAVAGGILNPAVGLSIVGGDGIGVKRNGREVNLPVTPSDRPLRVLASRSECERGLWKAVEEEEGLAVTPMGSVAYKMGRVAAGMDDVTWTPQPKHEWDVAGGAALIGAVGGIVLGLDGNQLTFNNPDAWLSGSIAIPPSLLGRRLEFMTLAIAQAGGRE